MRLLECKDGEFSLTKVYFNDVPKYAILSHRWDDDPEEEVTFRDLKAHTGKSKAGYKKIRFCGEQARRDGLSHFWVDTCCIDQSNSTELQETINCMFKFYRNADKCYVYLSDVSSPGFDLNNQPSTQPFESAFRASKWFTRGWTLQELIAPRSVEFFSQQGSRLGDKRTLVRQLHEITGVAVSALQGAPLSQFEVDERMSWAKNRQTKREEDEVYSLLGIFDVFMPLLYGEGRAKALIRLKKKINNSLNVGLGHKKRVMNWLSDTPYAEHHRQNGRSRSEGSGEWLLEMAKFKDWKTCPESAILWLRGSPGSGKTLLTSRVIDLIIQEKETNKSSTPIAYFYCSRSSDDTRRGDPRNVLRSLAKQLAQPGEPVPLAEPVDRRYKAMVNSDQEPDLDIDETIDLIIELKDIDSATIIIDGLDECNSQHGKRGALFQGLKKIASSPGKVVKIFVASRDEPDIMRAFSDYPHHFIDAQDNEADIRNYVKEQLKIAIQDRWKATGSRISPQLEMKIQKRLVNGAGGIFRWVSLQLQALFDTNINKLDADMDDQLSELPEGLKASYDVIYKQILAQGTSSQRIAHKAIAWLLCARQPISTLDFIQALNVGSDHPGIEKKEQVIDICRNFIKHDEDLDRFRIFHLSVTNYFEDQRPDWPKGLLNRVLADICLEQCLSPHAGQRTSIPNRDNKTFQDYANVYWPYHCSLAGPDQKLGILQVSLEEKLHRFLLGGQSTSREFATWNQQCHESINNMDLNAKDIDSKQLTTKLLDSLDQSYANIPSRTFVACAFGFSEIVKNMLDASEDFTVRSAYSRLRPLYIAIRHDHPSVQEAIRATVPVSQSRYIRSMEIHAAVRTGKDIFVELLLNQHSDNLITYGILEGAALHCNARTFRRLYHYVKNCVNGPMIQSDFWREDLLVVAARNGEHGDRIVRFLLPGLRTYNEEVYAAAASNENHGLSILRLLFGTFKPTRIDQRTIKSAASNHKTGRAILQLIFAQFPDWKLDEEVIITSASTGNARTLEILLDTFSPVHIPQEAFVAAATNETSGLELVELLLAYGFEVADLENVIKAAAGNQKSGLELMKLLLTYEFEISDLDNVIISAMRNPKSGSEIVKELLERFQGVTSRVMEEATSMPFPDMGIVKQLLNLPDNLTLDDAIIESAASNESSGSKLIELFLEERKDDLAAKSSLLAEVLTSNHTIEPAILQDALGWAENPSHARDMLWDAAKFRNAEVLGVCLDHVDIPEELSWLVEISAANESCGLEMIEMIFAKMPNLHITPEAIVIASRNQAFGHELVKYLLGRDAEAPVSIDAILAATKNGDKGRLVMPILLERFHGVFPLTEDIIIACASNLAHANDLMEMLLEHNMTDWSGEAALTTLFGQTLVQQGNFRCLKSLLGKVEDLCIGMEAHEFGRSSRIDAAVVERLLESCDDDLINYDLIYKVVSGAYHEDDLHFIEELLPRLQPRSLADPLIYQLAARRREETAQMLRLLQDSGFNTVIEKEIVLTAVRSYSVDVLVELGFAKWSFKSDEEVLQVAAENWSQGLRMLQLLLRQDASLQITESVLVAAAAVLNNQVVQTLQFLWRQDASLQITEPVLVAAAQNSHQALQTLRFLRMQDASLQITEPVLVAAAQNSHQAKQTLQFLLRQDASLQITEPVLVAAAQNNYQAEQTLRFLWRHDASLQITEPVLVSVAQNYFQPVQALRFLWGQDASLQITEPVLVSAAQNGHQAVQTLRFLWRQDASLQITEPVLVAAAENYKAVQTLRFLCRQDASLQITEPVLVSAAQNNHQAVQTLRFLWRQDASLQITEPVLVAAAQNNHQAVEALQFLWRQDASLQITEPVLVAAAENYQAVQTLQFLWRQDASLQITEPVLVAAAENYQAVQTLQFLWRQDASLQITEPVLVAAAQNDRQGVQTLQFLWRQDASLQITEPVLVAAAQNDQHAVQALQFLWRRDASLQITESVLVAAAENCQAVQTLQYLWRQDASLRITEPVLVAAAKNNHHAVQTLQFLWRQDASLQVSEAVLGAAIQNLQQGVPILKFLWSKSNNIEITNELFHLTSENLDYELDIVKKRWGKAFGRLTSRRVNQQLRLQKQQRKQIFDFLRDKQRCLGVAISLA